MLAEAIGLAPDGRAALLDRLRSADASVADQLAALLAADATADTTVATSGWTAPGDSPAPRPSALDIPGYRVLGVPGEGGWARCTPASNGHRAALAIRVLHTRSQGALVRFRAEAEIMARLEHRASPVLRSTLARS